MKAQVVRGSKQEIAEAIVRINGEVRERCSSQTDLGTRALRRLHA
jgi:hypothetical protein